MRNILHVSAHYGGGVNSVMRSWKKNDTENNHALSYLNDIPENKTPYTKLFNIEMIQEYDIVLCHVWNHPVLFNFLVNTKIPKCKMFGWSHMSGLYPPYVLFNKLVGFFDEFVYTSPVSNKTGIYKKSIWSCTDITEFANVKKNEHKTFNVGYVGTIDYCKLHSDFVKMCKEIDNENTRFIIIGGGCDLDNMIRETKELGLYDHFQFTGKVRDVKSYLSLFDVFMYPLYEKHFGTCEQVIGEAMASGIPCVVLNNGAESHIIDGSNGFICLSKESMIYTIKKFQDKSLSVSHNDEMYSRFSALKKYSPVKMIDDWNKIFDKNIEPRERYWGGGDPFIESLGPEGYAFRSNSYNQIRKLFKENRQWYSESKGSLKQYSSHFPENKQYKEWLKLL